MKFIELSQGYSAIVDDTDYVTVSAHKWYADVGKWTVYAKCDGIIGRPRLHVFIMRPDKNFIIHHADGNGLNCCRDNMVEISQKVHSRFSALRINKIGSKYRGVYFHKSTGKFAAEITVNYKKKYLGLYEIEEDAAMAYNKASIEIFGVCAVVNEIF